MSKTEYTPCPYCKSIVEVNIDWAIRNGRIFCGGCCKSFDIRVGEEEEETPPPVPEKEAPKLPELDLEDPIDKYPNRNLYDWDEF